MRSPTIVIDYDKKCRVCGKPGRTGCGLCFSCVLKQQQINRLGEKPMLNHERNRNSK